MCSTWAPSCKHVLEYIVVEQAQPAVADLQGDMAVAQVVGRAGQLEGAGAGDVQQLFGAARTRTTRPSAASRHSPSASGGWPRSRNRPTFAAAAEAAQATLAARVVGQFEFGLPFRAGRDALANHQHCNVPVGSFAEAEQGACQSGVRTGLVAATGSLCQILSRRAPLRCARRSWRRRAPYWCRLRTMYTAGIW